MARTCPHCQQPLPELTLAELSDALGGLELTRGLEVEPEIQQRGLGAWTETEEGPAFSVDPRALDEAREKRLREFAEQRRRR